ncbi:PREDICTED: uncharacterized protein LOC108577466 [Habropoda laboriosa]|uniref:uncharacterized protein LOC108577466 n=1 Tax=Habropoda laboriosa TaxID=597456 RepID=UPI00083D8A6E|nr:PREDICTED: uncharacterized protein LOC108577466 [Habropoda laboriosa]
MSLESGVTWVVFHVHKLGDIDVSESGIRVAAAGENCRTVPYESHVVCDMTEIMTSTFPSSNPRWHRCQPRQLIDHRPSGIPVEDVHRLDCVTEHNQKVDKGRAKLRRMTIDEKNSYGKIEETEASEACCTNSGIH